MTYQPQRERGPTCRGPPRRHSAVPCSLVRLRSHIHLSLLPHVRRSKRHKPCSRYTKHGDMAETACSARACFGHASIRQDLCSRQAACRPKALTHPSTLTVFTACHSPHMHCRQPHKRTGQKSRTCTASTAGRAHRQERRPGHGQALAHARCEGRRGQRGLHLLQRPMQPRSINAAPKQGCTPLVVARCDVEGTPSRMLPAHPGPEHAGAPAKGHTLSMVSAGCGHGGQASTMRPVLLCHSFRHARASRRWGVAAGPRPLPAGAPGLARV